MRKTQRHPRSFRLPTHLPAWLRGVVSRGDAFLDHFRPFRQNILKLILLGGTALFLFVAGSFVVLSFGLPDPNRLLDREIVQSTKIYARDGTTLLYDVHGEVKRTFVPLSDIPDNVKWAAIAIEDKDFYRNKGISIRGMIRAFMVNVLHGEIRQGGSTITQQLVKNAILTKERTFSRKIKEVVLSIRMEQRFTKDEILQLYLNEIPYGSNAYGIEAAAQTFFNKRARDLTLAEAAVLAALPRAPTYYSPRGSHVDELLRRKDLILDLMAEQGYITPEARDDAKAQKLAFNPFKDAIKAPHFALWIQEQLVAQYGERRVEEGGLKVITTLDPNLQQIAEEAIANASERNEKQNRATNAAFVAIDPKTGDILAMVGSRNWFDVEGQGNFNVALAYRQPGSSIKPVVYAAAFKEGASPATLRLDVKTNFGTYGGGKPYIPENYSGKENGPLSIRQALAGSLNIPAVKTLALIGVEKAVNTMQDLGYTGEVNTERCGLSLVLGGCEVRLLDHTNAFGVFATGGTRYPARAILSVADNKGDFLEEAKTPEGEQVLDPQVAYLVTSILSDNNARAFVFGARSPLVLGDRPVGAKTGTSQEWRDGWTVGYTPQLVAGVWVGNNDNSPMRAGADGVVVAAPIWNEFMRRALAGKPVESFERPTGITEVIVDQLTGKLPTAYTPSTKTEVFASFALPTEYDNAHIPVCFDRRTGQPATPDTPEEEREVRVATVLHSERPDDPAWEEPVRNWALANGYTYAQPCDGEGPIVPPEPVSINITEPAETEITNLPTVIHAEVSTFGQVDRVEFRLEDETIASFSSPPYAHVLQTPFVDGLHELSVRVILKNGIEAKGTKVLRFALGKEFVLLGPRGAISNFPVMLRSESVNQIDDMRFFLKDSRGRVREIAGNIQENRRASSYLYSLEWKGEGTRSGTYTLFAASLSAPTRLRTEEVVIRIP
jgi:1A family penicillin-binding protein